MVILTKKDRSILEILDFDARTPITQIAKKVQLAPEVVKYRITRLENLGIISGYYTVIDLSKLGFLYCRFIIEFNKLNNKTEQKLQEFIEKNPNFSQYIIRSNMVVSVAAYFTSIFAVKEKMIALNIHLHSFLHDTQPSFATHICHYKRNYLYEKNDSRSLQVANKNQIKVDRMDLQILSLIHRDARLSVTRLAEQIKTTPMTIINHMRSMKQKGIIVGYRYELNFQQLGYTHYKLEVYTSNLSDQRRTELLEVLAQHPHVVYITKVIDRWDLEVQVHFQTSAELYNFLTTLYKRFPEINKIKTIHFHKKVVVREYPDFEQIISD